MSQRSLDTATLNGAAGYYASLFLRDAPPWDRTRVMREFHKFTFADEFDYLVGAVRHKLGQDELSIWDAMAAEHFEPRDAAEFERLLAEKLAISPGGEHIAGLVGTTKVGARLIGRHLVEVETPTSLRRRKLLGLGKDARETHFREANHYWPIYAGEGQERAAGSDAVDPLPPGTPPLPVGALNTRISNECALLGCDAIVDNLDEGTGAAVIQGRSGAQPADPDTAVTGTLLFTLTCSATAFGAAADANPGAIATAAAITDDTSADATGTVGYCRASSTNDGVTPLDDHIDGEAGTSGADWNFNTVSIVAGSTVSASSWTFTLPES